MLARAQQQQQEKEQEASGYETDGRGGNVGEFCTIDASGKRVPKKSLMEKENDFLEVCPRS